MNEIARAIITCAVFGAIAAVAWWYLVRSITKRLDRIEWALRIELLEKQMLEEGGDDTETRP